MITLRHPEPEEAVALTDLCLRSKAVWGYDRRFLEACRSEITLTPAYLRSPGLQVAELDGRVIGVVEVTSTGKDAELAKLFVEPDKLRTGVGRTLFEWAKTAAIALGASVLTIDSDPGAANFYRRMGAIDDGIVPFGSIPGRSLPRLVFRLCEQPSSKR